MLIVCPSCATAFRVAESVLGDTGRQVRCAQCRTVWMATPDSAVDEERAAALARSAREAAAAGAAPARPQAPPAEEADWGAAFAEEAAANAQAVNTQAASAQAAPSGGSPQAPATAARPEPDLPAEPALPEAEAPPIQPDQEAPPMPPRARGADAPSAGAGRPQSPAGGLATPLRRFRRAPAAPSSGRSFRFSPAAAVLLLGTAILATFLLGREQVVRTVPDSAGLYERLGLPVNLRGVEFRGLGGAKEIVDGVVVLVVEGQLVNITGRTVDLPRLRLAVRDAAGKEIYTWTATPPKMRLEAGESVPFRSRLASPPPDGSSIEVRFFTAADAGR